jgi:Fis family transcriptional regulator, factor for inversion stimulation protein
MPLEAKTTTNTSPLTVPKEKANEPLRECVRGAIGQYLALHQGHEVNDLYSLVMHEVEAPLFESVLRHSGHNQTQAAAMLGISRSTLRKKLAVYGLN